MNDQLQSLLDEAGSAANAMSGDVAKLTVLLHRLIGAARDTVKECDVEELDTLLRDLNSAADFYNGHHNDRFKEESRKEYDIQSQECHDDWSECCHRKDKAVMNLTKYARLYVENNSK